MANHASHAALPYPIKGARFSLLLPYLDADGDPTAPTTPDTEVSKDNGAAADCAEEASATSGMDGMALLTLTGAETDCSCLALNAKVASGPKATLATLYPRVLASIGTGTLSAGSAGGGTLGTVLPYDLTGCFIKTTGGTGGGGTGGANNQVRKIATYTPGTGAFTVVPNWETAVSTDTTYELLLPEGVTLGMLQTLNPTTAGRKLTVESDGMGHADVKEIEGADPTDTIRDSVVDDATRLDASELNGLNEKIDTIDDFLDAEIAQLLADTAELLTRLTSARAGYLDNLNVGGPVASSAEATAIQNNTRVVRVVPEIIERPDSGTVTYRVELFLYDEAGNMEAPDSAPTIALVNQAGTDRSSRLDSATMALVETGRYRAIYTADAGDALEQLVWTFTVVEGGATRKYGNSSYVVDTTAVDFTAADRTKLDTLHDSRLTAARAALLDQLDPAVGGTAAAEIDVLLSRITAAVALASVCTETRLARLDAAISSRAVAGDQMNLADGAITAAKLAAAALTAAKFGTGAITADALAADAAAEIRDAIKTLVVEAEGSITFQQAQSIMLAVLAGVTAAAGATIKTPNGAATRVAATVNGSQERTGMVLTPSS